MGIEGFASSMQQCLGHTLRAPPFARRRKRIYRTRGFTLIEVLIVVGIIGLLTAIAVPVISRARAASKRVTCISNLHQIAAAFHVFADRNGGYLPDPSASQVSWETSLAVYITPHTFACPGDSELYPAVGSSYDWRDTPDPATTLAGQRITTPGRSSLILVFEALPGWHARNRICAARLDGSAGEMDYVACMQDLETDNALNQPRVQ